MDFARPIEALIGGTRGRLLAVLAETTAPLTLRQLAQLADVSPAQASRVMPSLVELGVVVRFEVPPSSQFVLNRDNVASGFLCDLADARRTALDRLGQEAAMITPSPASVVVFGSIARGGSDRESDIDVAVIRHDHVDSDAEDWSQSIEDWRVAARAITGNDVEVLEASVSEAAAKLGSRSQLWRDIAQDGVVIHGQPLNQLQVGIGA